jgi:cysteine synthase
VDRQVIERTAGRCREAGVRLPTFRELAEPHRIPAAIRDRLAGVDPDAPHPLNLFRVHWHNTADRRGLTPVPEHVVLPPELTGVAAPIVALLGNRFPMIRAHKVLAAYACLAPHLVAGTFDPTRHKAVWPSTGNYCRGGVAISRIMGCRGVAVLPEGMSAERFAWLAQWVLDPADVIRTPGTESNVKEIYDACHELARDPANVVFNQFSELGNYAAHYECTGRALETVFEAFKAARPSARLAAFVSASGSAGTLGAGDYLKDRHGTRIVAAEALECPTLLYNGFGEHNIQGIGDKHVPFIHNVMNTDAVTAVSDRATDALNVVFNTAEGARCLAGRRGVAGALIEQLRNLGLSSICNVVAAIKTARYYDLGPADVVITVATDGAEMYGSERDKTLDRVFKGTFGAADAAAAVAQHLGGAGTDHFLELTERDRTRIFNLGYYTWVEQQGVTLAAFEERRSQAFWRRARGRVAEWDAAIADFNRRVQGTAGG